MYKVGKEILLEPREYPHKPALYGQILKVDKEQGKLFVLPVRLGRVEPYWMDYPMKGGDAVANESSTG